MNKKDKAKVYAACERLEGMHKRLSGAYGICDLLDRSLHHRVGSFFDKPCPNPIGGPWDFSPCIHVRIDERILALCFFAECEGDVV